MYDAILVPTDGRANTERAIEEAIELADVHDAALHTVYVINSTAIAPGIDFEDLEEIGHDAVEYVQRSAEASGLEDVKTTVTHGLRHRAILTYANDHDIDLIVMGRHRNLDRFFRGSVSDRVSEESAIPVLIVE